MLNETAPPVIGQPILEEFARHLKLSDMPEAGANSDAETALRAAIAHLEAQLGLALVQRSFAWQGRLNDCLSFRAPMAPISEVLSVQRQHANGDTSPLDLGSVVLDRSDLRARITTRMTISDPVTLTFVAGFGSSWADAPADLRRACFMLAAHYFDTRHDVGEAGDETPHGVTSLIAPWRPLRLSMGAPE